MVFSGGLCGDSRKAMRGLGVVSCVWPFVVCLVNLVEVAVAELEVLLGVRECVRCRSGGSSRMAWVVLCGGSVLALSFC